MQRIVVVGQHPVFSDDFHIADVGIRENLRRRLSTGEPRRRGHAQVPRINAFDAHGSNQRNHHRSDEQNPNCHSLSFQQ